MTICGLSLRLKSKHISIFIFSGVYLLNYYILCDNAYLSFGMCAFLKEKGRKATILSSTNELKKLRDEDILITSYEEIRLFNKIIRLISSTNLKLCIIRELCPSVPSEDIFRYVLSPNEPLDKICFKIDFIVKNNHIRNAVKRINDIERMIALLSINNYTVRNIARKFDISVKSVYYHKLSLKKKIRAENINDVFLLYYYCLDPLHPNSN